MWIKREDTMARLDPIPRERMTEDQIRINDEISAKRSGGQASGPFGLWLRTPELADRANKFGSYLRYDTSVPQRLVELAVLAIARHWTAQYEWFAHARYVEKVGLDPAIAEAIRTRKTPDIAKDDEKAVYALTMELCEDRTITDETYARALDLFGEQMVLELVTIIGFYTMVAVVLVSFRVDIPDDGAPPLDE
jgi:4-carboxymuconolactone decarboxylase